MTQQVGYFLGNDGMMAMVDFDTETGEFDCDTCRQLAPATFGETGDFSFVQLGPGKNPAK